MTGSLPRGAFACLALLASLTSAGAHDLHAKPACKLTYDKAVEIGHNVVAQNPDATYTEYSGDEAKKLVDSINTSPPPWPADKILVLGGSDELPFRVAFIDNGCVTHAIPVPHQVWLDIVSAALGDKS